MARPKNEQRQLLRRDQFLDAVEAMLSTTAFDDVSLEEVNRATGLSKGAFYHYFPSKAALLQGLVERMADRLSAKVASVLPTGTSAERLSALLSTVGTWKQDRLPQLRNLLLSWFADGNAALRLRIRRETAGRLAPILTGVLHQGIERGEMNITDASGTARLIVDLVQDTNDRIGWLIVEGGGVDVLNPLMRELDLLEYAITRLTSLPAGSITLTDRRRLAAAFKR